MRLELGVVQLLDGVLHVLVANKLANAGAILIKINPDRAPLKR